MTKINCAVYVRKSTEHGLDQEFNSLDNQDTACRAYIASQAFNNWEYFKTYADGGISGGTMERPALQQMLDDIKAGKIQIVLVYKIDRLSRSIMDFHNMMKVFYKNDCNFVSITQAFDTSTSMGKLTLNMLLSFAQFEREVSSERVRDKIRASRAKGIWTGGIPMLGYDSVDKKLVVNQAEAGQVRIIFELYLQLNSVSELMTELRTRGITSKKWVTDNGKTRGGKPLLIMALHKLLRNKIYIGILEHKANKTIAKGEHTAIISEPLFNAVQQRLRENTNGKMGRTNSSPNLLTGKLYNADGILFTNSITRSKIGHRPLYYYATQSKYIRCTNIDSVTITTVREFINSDLSELPDVFAHKLKQIDYENLDYINRKNFIKTIIEKAILTDNKLTLFLKLDSTEIDKFTTNYFINQHNDPMQFTVNDNAVIIEHEIVITNRKQQTKYNTGSKGLMTVKENNTLVVRAFTKAFKYRELYEEIGNMKDILKIEKTGIRTLQRYLNLAYMHPKNVNELVSGRRHCSVTELFNLASKSSEIGNTVPLCVI